MTSKTAALCGILSIFLFGATSKADVERPSLLGYVLDAQGRPVKGATVLVYSAGPRTGTGSFCPTCYADCRKTGVTDAEGRFEIGRVDPKLVFRLLVLNKGYRPTFAPKVDPRKDPVKITIEPREEVSTPHKRLRGRIINPEGAPIERAVVNFIMAFGEEANCAGNCPGIDMVSATEADGTFYLGSQKKFDWMHIQVDAPGFARKNFLSLRSESFHELKVEVGATLAGRIMKDGKPVKGLELGLAPVDRAMETWTGTYTALTQESGRFVFPNLPSNREYVLCSLMNPDKNDNMIVPVQTVSIEGDGSVKDFGDVNIRQGIHLTGKITLADGKPLPAETRVYVNREDAWDLMDFTLAPDGSFDLKGIPPEVISIGVRAPGYTVSAKNKSFDRVRGNRIIGVVTADTHLEILLEPGTFQRDFSITPAEQKVPTRAPLRGVEKPSTAL
jgi:hypothetical protein